ncbi:hypothetical protein N7488_012230 [Penicillium malachiteum]|nr:hypothetical protein N7488_012230 [Penicillium malachiteum]
MSTRDLPLNVLPMDCWYMVLDYLQPSDLSSLSRVCKVLYQNIIPHLYRKIAWNWNQDPLPRILNLLGAIHDHPERVKLIERIEFTVPPEDDRLISGLTRENRNLVASGSHDSAKSYTLCLNILHQSNMPDIHVWVRLMNKGDPCVFATLLISQLPNLRCLSLDCSFVILGGLPGMMLNHAMFTAPEETLSKFEHLERVEYGPNSARIRLDHNIVYSTTYAPNIRAQHNPYQFTGFFFLPSLKMLSMWISTSLVPRLLSDANKKRPHTMGNLHSLHFEGTCVKACDVNFLLKNMTNLKQLSLQLSYLYPYEAWFSAQDLQEGLKSVAPTLKRLSFRPFHFSFFYLSPWPNPEDPRNLKRRPSLMKFTTGFFTQFPNLISLDIPAVYLSGGGYERETLIENLPYSLEVLQLRDQTIDMCWPGRKFDELFCLVRDFFPENIETHPYLDQIFLDFAPLMDFWTRLQGPRYEFWEFGQQIGTPIYVRVPGVPGGRAIPLYHEDEVVHHCEGDKRVGFGDICYSLVPPGIKI